MSWQIAIDGPAGAGKSTIAKAVAQRLGFQYIDTGAMYRAVTLKALRRQINMYEKDEYNFLKDTVIDFKDDKIYLDGTCVSAEIRSLEVSNHVSIVAQIEYVREKLVLLQRNLAKEKDVIMDGRDIGTVVLPNADLKIYLNATVQERAKRRLNERLEKNQAVQTFAETIKEIIDRDYKDSNRSISPLVKAPDAIEIDSSELSVEAVIEKIINLFLERGYRMENLELNTKQEQKTEETKTNEKPVENIEKEEQPKKRTQVKANAEEEKPKEEPKKTTRVKKATPAAEEKTDITEEVEVEKPKKKTTAKTKKEDAVVAEQAEVTEEKAAPKKKTATKTKKEDAVVAEQAEVTEEKAAPKKKAATKTKKEDAVVAEQAEVTEEKAVPKKKAATKSKKEDVAETEAAPAAEVTPEAEPKMKPAAKSKKEASAEVEVAFDPEVSKADLKEPAEPAAASEVKSDETAPADSKEETLAQAAAPETKAEAEELVEDDEDYPDNDDEEDDEVQDEYSEDEEDEASADEAVDKKAADRPLPVKKYRQLQVVQGKVLEVIEAQPERKIGNRVLRAKEERVLIELEDGQQGFLFRKDTADIADDQDLFDLFIEGDNITCVIKKIYPDGGKFIFSTVLLKMRNDLSKFQDVIKNHGIFTAKVIRKLSVGYLLKHNEFSCLLPISQVVVPEEERGNLIGQDIEVAPIRIDYGRIRLIVSQNVANAIIKRREKEAFISHIEVGQEFDGVVKNIESYGAFVDVGNGVEGLLHISELDHVRVSKVEKVLNPGDTVRVKVIKIDGIHIGLSRKALLPNYWLEYAEKHEVGSVVTGKITEINNYGVVVDLNEDVSAFLPRSEFAWEKDVYISDSAAVDDEIEMKIIEVDPIKRRIILSRKQLTPNPWEKLTCRPGDTINVEVVKELKDGYKISCQGAVGYLPKASIANYHEEISIGTELRVKVRVFDPKRTKLVVNLRAETERHPRNSFRQHQKTQDKLTNTFGDLLKSQLKDPKE